MPSFRCCGHQAFDHGWARPGPELVQPDPGTINATMTDSDLPAVEESTPVEDLILPPPPGLSDPSPSGPGPPVFGPRCRPPLAEKALAASFPSLRYRDTSLLIWQQQQQELQSAPPSNYLSRSQSAWYSSYGNQAVLVRDKKELGNTEGQSRICTVM